MADDTLETAVKGARIDLLGLVLKTGSLMAVSYTHLTLPTKA